MTCLVRGRVLDAAGQPQPELLVRLQPRQPLLDEPPDGRNIVEGWRLPLPLLQKTAADGGFLFETRATGPAQLMVLAGGAPHMSEVDLRPGESTDLGAVRIP